MYIECNKDVYKTLGLGNPKKITYVVDFFK